MYDIFLPEISRFVEDHEEVSNVALGACFPKFFGHFENETAYHLVLEDFTYREQKCIFKYITTLEEGFSIAKRLGNLYGIFYSWKELKYPNRTAEELQELYPAFQHMSLLNGKEGLLL